MCHPCHQYRESFPWNERPPIPFCICVHETEHDRSNRGDVGTVGFAVDVAADMSAMIHAAAADDAPYVIRHRDLPCQTQQKQQRLENKR